MAKSSGSKQVNILRTVFILLIILLLMITSFSLVNAAATVPTPGELLPPGGSPLDIAILVPSQGEQFSENKEFKIVVDFVALASLAKFELYANGEQYRGFDLSGSYNHERKEFTYRAEKAGLVTFIVRAWDVEGNMGISNPVTVQIINPLPVVATMPIEEGTTLQQVADQTGFDLYTLQALNYGTDPDNPNQLGTEVNIPVEHEISAGQQIQTLPWPGENSEPAALDMASTANLSTSIATYLNTLIGQDELPSPPTVTIEHWGCAQQLIITDTADNETGFFVYRARGYGAFERIATLKANSGSERFVVEDELVFGNVVYYVAAFNGAGEAPSAPVTAIGVDGGTGAKDPQCLREEWLQPVWTRTDFQINAPVDSFFCYAATFDSLWQRIPQNPRESFSAASAGDGKPMAMPLPWVKNMADSQYSLECWGYSGETLVSLGSGTGVFSREGDVAKLTITGPSFSFEGEVGWTADNLPNTLPPENKLLTYPIGLRFTRNPQDSRNHSMSRGSGIMVDHYVNVLKSGKSILVWDTVGVFPGPGQVVPVADLKYYHVYLYDYGTRNFEHFKWVSHMMTMTDFAIPWEKNPGQPACFAVRAKYELEDGSMQESQWSNIACMQPDEDAIELETAILTPSDMQTFYEYKHSNTVGTDVLLNTVKVGSGQSDRKNPYSTDVWTPTIRFDLSDYTDVAIQKAHLSFRMKNGGRLRDDYSGIAWGGSPSCYQTVRYRLGSSFVNVTSKNILYHSGTKSFDVTEEVNLVMNFLENELFVVDLQPWNFSDLGITPDKRYGFFCWAIYDSFELELTYFPRE